MLYFRFTNNFLEFDLILALIASETMPSRSDAIHQVPMVDSPSGLERANTHAASRIDKAFLSKARRRISEPNHFLTTTTALPTAQPVAANELKFARSKSTKWGDTTTSIVAASIIGVITFAAILFLLIWYINRERRRWRQRQTRRETQGLFCPSSLTLAEETSKVLDEFLMKDIEPERASLMFSRSRSPSITFAVDNADARKSTTRFYRTSYEASTNSLTKLDSLTRVSTDGTRPSLLVSGISDPAPSTSVQAPSSTRRASRSSTTSPTAQSSQLSQSISATTYTTEVSSIFSQGPMSSRTPNSNSAPRNANLPSSSSGSIPPRSTNTSRTSSQLSRLSRSGPRHSGGRASQDTESSRHAQARSHRLSQSTIISPVEESSASAESSQLPSIPTTPTPLFRFSEA